MVETRACAYVCWGRSNTECGPWKPFVADRGNLSGSRGREPRGILLLLLRLRARPPRLPFASLFLLLMPAP